MRKPVYIIVHDDTITVSPTIVRASVRQRVQWQAPGADSFVLVFRDGAAVARSRGPTQSVEVRSVPKRIDDIPDWIKTMVGKGNVPDEIPVAQATISGTLGVHQYQLAILKDDKLYIDVGCPEVIIE